MAHLLNNCRRIPSDHDDAGPAPGQREGNASADASRPADDQGSLPGDEAGGNLFDRRWHGCHIPDGGILRRRREEDGPADQVGDHSGHDRLD